MMFERQRSFEDVAAPDFYNFLKSTHSNRFSFEADGAKVSGGLGGYEKITAIGVISSWELARRQSPDWDLTVERNFLDHNSYRAEAEFGEGSEDLSNYHGNFSGSEYSKTFEFRHPGTGRVKGKTELKLSEVQDLLS